ncbi:MAG: hypothetical protein WDM81_01965 [Rhizomicrobium sp.]
MLNGYKTYVVGVLTALGALGGWLSGGRHAGRGAQSRRAGDPRHDRAPWRRQQAG